MLIKNHAAKYPVEGVDYICMTQEESVSIWGQRKRSSSIGSQSVQQEASIDNIFPTLLDYDANERITPVHVATPVLPVTPITVPGYSPQLSMGSLQRPVYNPTPLHQIAPVRSSQSDLLQMALQSTQIASSDHRNGPCRSHLTLDCKEPLASALFQSSQHQVIVILLNKAMTLLPSEDYCQTVC